MRITFHILLLLLFSLKWVSCQESLSTVERLDITMEDLETFVAIDSVNYNVDVQLFEDNLYVVGYAFRNKEKVVSKINCIDLKSKTLKWSTKLDSEQTHQDYKITILDNKLYLTGVSGWQDMSGKMDFKLYPTIIEMDLEGNILRTVKVNQMDAKGNATQLVEWNDDLYFAYGTYNPNIDGSKFGTSLVRLSKNLATKEIISLGQIHFNSFHFYLLKDNLYLTGMGGNETIALIEVDKNMKYTKLTKNMRSRETPRINKFICVKNEDENELNYVAVGSPSIGSRKQYIARFNFDGEELEFMDKIEFPDSTYIETYPMLDQQGFYGLKSDKKGYALFKLNGKRIEEYISMKKEYRFIQILQLEKPSEAIYMIRKNRRLLFCKIKENLKSD